MHASPEFESRLARIVEQLSAEFSPNPEEPGARDPASGDRMFRALDQLHELDFQLMTVAAPLNEATEEEHLHCILVPRLHGFQAADHPTEDPLHAFNPACGDAVAELLKMLRGSGYAGVFPSPASGLPVPAGFPHRAPWCRLCAGPAPAASVLHRYEGMEVPPLPDVFLRPDAEGPPPDLPPAWERLRILAESVAYPCVRERGQIPPMIALLYPEGEGRLTVLETGERYCGVGSWARLVAEVQREIERTGAVLVALCTSGTGRNMETGEEIRLMMMHVETAGGVAFALATPFSRDPEGPGYVIGETARQGGDPFLYPD